MTAADMADSPPLQAWVPATLAVSCQGRERPIHNWTEKYLSLVLSYTVKWERVLVCPLALLKVDMGMPVGAALWQREQELQSTDHWSLGTHQAFLETPLGTSFKSKPSGADLVPGQTEVRKDIIWPIRHHVDMSLLDSEQNPKRNITLGHV